MSDDDHGYDLDGEPAAAAAPPASAPGPEAEYEEYASPVVNWRELDPADAGPVWEELGSWVAWARDRYELRKLHPCWFKHPAAVEHLSALHTAWTVLFSEEDSGLGPVTFLEKLRGATPAIEKALEGCTLKEHSGRGLNAWPAVDDDPHWRELIGS